MFVDAAHQFARFKIQEGQNSGRDQRYLRGSSLYACPRKQAYSLLGYQPLPNTAHSQQILDLGNQYHDALQIQLTQMGWIDAKPIWNEKKQSIDWEQGDDKLSGCELDVIDHNLKVIGHLDGITVPLNKTIDEQGRVSYNPDPNGKRYLIEIKTISDRPRLWILGVKDGGANPLFENECNVDFIDLDMEEQSSKKLQQRLSNFSHSRDFYPKFGKKKQIPVYKVKVGGEEQLVSVVMLGNSAGAFTGLKKPKDAHITQASFYANHHNIKDILFIYIGKETTSEHYTETNEYLQFPIKIFEHEVDPFDVEMTEAKINMIYSYVEENQLPPRPWEDPSDEGAECKWCGFLPQCFGITRGTEDLEGAGLKPIILGPNVIHLQSDNLEEEFRLNKPG